MSTIFFDGLLPAGRRLKRFTFTWLSNVDYNPGAMDAFDDLSLKPKTLAGWVESLQVDRWRVTGSSAMAIGGRRQWTAPNRKDRDKG
jgi:hypothetical protein